MGAETKPIPPQTPEYMAADRGITVISVIVSITAISTLFVGARIFSRTRLAGRMFLDDWLVIISAVRHPAARWSSRTSSDKLELIDLV